MVTVQCSAIGYEATIKISHVSHGKEFALKLSFTNLTRLNRCPNQSTVLQSRESPRRMRRSGAILWMNGEFIRSHTRLHSFPLADFKGKTITLIKTCLYYPCYKIRSPNEILLISRPMVFMRNKSCRVRCLTYVRSMGGSSDDVSEEPVHRRSERRVGVWAVAYVKQWKGWRMSCDIGKATEGLENERWRRWSDGNVGEWAELIVIVELILQPSRHFTYVTAHSPTLPSLSLRHSSFSSPSVALRTPQLILQPFFRIPYAQALHLRHLTSRPCFLRM